MKNMQTIKLLALSLLLLSGAGCLSGGGNPKATTGGVWSTANGGKNWTALNVLPTASAVGSIGAADVLVIERDPSNPEVLYAGTKANGVLYSLTGGSSWEVFPAEEAFKEVREGAVLDIEVSPKDPCTIFILKTKRLIKTETCGRSFNISTYVEDRTDESLTALALDWYNPNNVWLGNTAGDVLRSLDGGANWASATRLRDDITGLEISNADSRILLAGTARNSIYRTTDAGLTWTELEDQFKKLKQADRVYDFTPDAGLTWTELEDQFKKLKQADRVYDFTQTNDGKVLLMSSAYGLFKSVDNGATWQALSLVTAQGEVTIYAVEVAPNNGQLITYSTDSTLYLSNDGGVSWSTEELPTSRSAQTMLLSDDGKVLLIGLVELEKK